MLVSVFALSCFEPEGSGDGTDASTGVTSITETSSSSGPTSTTSADTTGIGTETDPLSTSNNPSAGMTDTTGACMPGVFGQSRFGQACFQ